MSKIFENETFNSPIDLNEYDEKDFIFKKCKIDLSTIPFKIGFKAGGKALYSSKEEIEQDFFHSIKFIECEIHAKSIEFEKVMNIEMNKCKFYFPFNSFGTFYFPFKKQYANYPKILIKDSYLEFLNVDELDFKESSIGSHPFVSFLTKVDWFKNCSSNIKQINVYTKNKTSINICNEILYDVFKKKDDCIDNLNEYLKLIKEKINEIKNVFGNKVEIKFKFFEFNSLLEKAIFLILSDQLTLGSDFDIFFDGIKFVEFFENS